jgi:hypothetical protein
MEMILSLVTAALGLLAAGDGNMHLGLKTERIK